MAIRAMSSAYSANLTLREGVGMLFTYRLNSTGEMSLPCASPAHMLRHVDVADLKTCETFGSGGMTMSLSPSKVRSFG
jgi:hypothetical protein